MKKALYFARLGAILIGCILVLISLLAFFVNSITLIINANQYSYSQNIFQILLGYFNSFIYNTTVGVVLALLALKTNPEKVAPLFDFMKKSPM